MKIGQSQGLISGLKPNYDVKNAEIVAALEIKKSIYTVNNLVITVMKW